MTQEILQTRDQKQQIEGQSKIKQDRVGPAMPFLTAMSQIQTLGQNIRQNTDTTHPAHPDSKASASSMDIQVGTFQRQSAVGIDQFLSHATQQPGQQRCEESTPSHSVVSIQNGQRSEETVINQRTGSDQRHTGTFNAQGSQISEFPIRVGSFTSPLDSLQVEQSPLQVASMHDSVGSHIPQKIKEKIWAGDYIELSLLLKSAKELVSDPQYSGELTIKGGQLTVVQQKQSPINNIHVWTSAFIIYMGVMLEKWPNKGHEYLKYMYNVRLAAERGSGTGWVTYDEQFRLRKARSPTSAWGDVDMELWLIYVATHEKPKLSVGQTFNNAYDFQKRGSYNGNRAQGSGFRTCWGFNRGNCQFGRNCRFAHKCTTCFGPHPQTKCRK